MSGTNLEIFNKSTKMNKKCEPDIIINATTFQQHNISYSIYNCSTCDVHIGKRKNTTVNTSAPIRESHQTIRLC